MASIIPELIFSPTYHDNTSLFPNNFSELAGGLVPQPASEESAVWNDGANFAEEDFEVPRFDNFCSVVDGFSSSSSSEKMEICDVVVPAFSAEYINNNNISSHNNNSGIDFPGAHNYSNYGLEYNINVPFLDNGLLFDQFGEEYCCGAEPFLPESFKPFSFVGEQKNWGIMQSTQMNGIIEESNIMKVGRYSEEERKERIVRYLKKRNQRNFNKTIKYACRKTLADRRVRVRGRFARNNNELCDHHDDRQIVAEKNDIDLTQKDMKLGCNDALQMIKYDDDEEWLQNIALCCWVNGGSNISNS